MGSLKALYQYIVNRKYLNIAHPQNLYSEAVQNKYAFCAMAPQRGRARRESPIASLDLSTVCQALCRQSHLSLREGIQSFVEKVDRSLMNLDTYPRIGKPFISTFKSFFGFSSHS